MLFDYFGDYPMNRVRFPFGDIFYMAHFALKREVERTDIERERERENLTRHLEDMRKALAQLTEQWAGRAHGSLACCPHGSQ